MCSAPTPVSVSTDDVRPGIVRVRAAAGTLGSFAVARLGSAIDAALARRPWGVVVDLRPLDAVTPAGLAMLVRVAGAAGESDIGLSMVCPDVLRSALAQSGLTGLFDLNRDLDAALAVLGVVV
jgi:anti-anti-sigma regulatory factor